MLQVMAKCKLHLCLPNYTGLKTLPRPEIFQNVDGWGKKNETCDGAGGGVFT
jgi:hypothetical protein